MRQNQARSEYAALSSALGDFSTEAVEDAVVTSDVAFTPPHSETNHDSEAEERKDALTRLHLEAEELRTRYSEMVDFAPIGYFALDSQENIQEANLMGASLLGSDRMCLTGQAFSGFIAPPFQTEFQEYCALLLSTGIKQTCELRLLTAAGAAFEGQLEGIAVRSANGKDQGFRIALLDITVRKQAQEALQRRNTQIVLIDQHSARLHRASSPNQLYKFVVEAVASVFPTDSVMLCIANEETHTIRAVAVHGFPHGILKDTVRHLSEEEHPEEDVHAFVWRTGQSVASADNRTPLHHRATVEKYGLSGASIVMPMRDRHGIVGTLGFLRPGLADPSTAIPEEDVRLISVFVNEAGIALENLRLYQQLRQRRERLHNILVNVPIVIWEVWEEEEIRALRQDYVSDYMRTMLGYSISEWLRNRDFWLRIVHPEDRDDVRMVLEAVRQSGGPHDLCFRWIAKEGRELWVETRLTAIQDEGGAHLGVRGVALDITDRKNAEEKVRQLYQQLLKQQRLITHGFLNRLEEERRTVAVQLHDGLVQYVMAAQAFLDTYADKYRLALPDSLPGELRKGLEHLTQAVLEARRMVNSLQSLALDDLGLAGALEQLVSEEKQRAGWPQADFEVNLSEQRYDVALETAVYRVAQEALSNVRKHAGAHRVQIVLRSEGEAGNAHLTLEVRDWGRGFLVQEKRRDYAHLGLHSMEEHVNLLQGRFEIESSPGMGTQMRASFPIHREEAVPEP